MEPESIYGYTAQAQAAVRVAPAPRGQALWHHPLNPPASRQVLERLASYLTPPQAHIVRPRQTAAGAKAYDTMAATCVAEAHRPAPEMLWAYEACTEVIRRHSKSFYFSARLLPPGKREGITALYAFCRLSDDLVDNADAGANPAVSRAQSHLSLGYWSQINSRPVPGVDHPVVTAWADTRNRFGIPQTLADELLEGVRMDLTISRYATWDDLWVYCYRVASTVGLMSMYITGTDTMDAVPFAVQLGVALQLTNILRDVGEDARTGRIYLPREDMERFGYTEEMLMRGERNEAFVELMKFEIERAHALYDAAQSGINMLPRDSRLAVSAAATLYRGILGKIEEANYEVFNYRAHLSLTEKLRALPGLWLSVKRSG